MEIDGAGYGENIRIDESIIGDDIADGACASETRYIQQGRWQRVW